MEKLLTLFLKVVHDVSERQDACANKFVHVIRKNWLARIHIKQHEAERDRY